MVNKGTLVSDILTKGMVGMEYRIISGDILSGIAVERDQPIGYYHETISVVNNEFIRQFMGWLSPGFNKYSISHSFLSSLFPKIKQTLTTSMNGDVRSIVPLGLIEKMCLLNILPTMLLKSIISRDIEFMEYLGIYECDPEDFSLCSFIDASKMDIMSIIQDGLDYAEIEG